MSVVCGCIYEDRVSIACDTQTSFGSINVDNTHLINASKIYKINSSYIGIVGWSAISDIMEHVLKNKKKLFKLDSRSEIFETLLALQSVLKEEYFLETHEDSDQPVDSNQLDAIIINKKGLFTIGSYREVQQFKTFWAMGSGKQLALGAMHAMYHSGKYTSQEIVEAGVRAACEFHESCSLPLYSKTIKLEL